MQSYLLMPGRHAVPQMNIHIHIDGSRLIRILITNVFTHLFEFILLIKTKISFYCIPLSRNFNCHSQAERKVSSIVSTAFQPSSLLAKSGLAQTFTISPVRRPTIL